MADLTLTRMIPASRGEVWTTISSPEGCAMWWGPDGFSIDPASTLDFRREGPWSCTMISPEGNRLTVSGHVTHVRAEQSVGFTWGWEDPDGGRGPESHVIISLEDGDAGQTQLTLSHTEFVDEHAAEQHRMGWLSTFGKFDKIFSP